MNENRYQKVISANGTLQAASIQIALEKAGIPVTVAHAKGETYLDVLVPAASVEEAHLLLYPDRPRGEILFVPAAEANG